MVSDNPSRYCDYVWPLKVSIINNLNKKPYRWKENFVHLSNISLRIKTGRKLDIALKKTWHNPTTMG